MNVHAVKTDADVSNDVSSFPQGVAGARPCDALASDKVPLAAILVATNFSEHATYAADRALMLATEVGMSRVSMLHVLDDPNLLSLRPLLAFSNEASARRATRTKRQLEALLEQGRQRSSAHIEQHLHSGAIVDTISTFSERADLVLLGAEGARPLRDFALGSTTRRLLRKTKRPLLAIRRKPTESYRDVLIAVDVSQDFGGMLTFAATLAPRATLHVVHVYDIPQEGKMRFAGVGENTIDYYRMQARSAAARKLSETIGRTVFSRRAKVSLLHGYAVTRLLEKEQTIDADLVIVKKRDKSLAAELLIESVALQLLARSQADVLVVR